MLNRKITILLMIFIFSTSFSSLAWSSENYEDCIFKNMKGIGSDLGAKEIIDLCKAKHINTKYSICFEIDAQTINGIIFLQDINEPYTGNNLCKYSNGQVKSKGNIKNGKLDGRMTFWYGNGQIWTEELYIEGNLVDKTKYSYYENGEMRSEAHYINGKLEGIGTYWYENSQKGSEGDYKDGKKNGKWTTWYENGLKWTDRNYKDGREDGKSTEWFANGQIKSEENYKDGKKET
jgi:antitoxin component YwqK of YwqJK toxin-antitoxin module